MDKKNRNIIVEIENLGNNMSCLIIKTSITQCNFPMTISDLTNIRDEISHYLYETGEEYSDE